jgi:glycosyltransferase involved in cell wall biosynthesis
LKVQVDSELAIKNGFHFVSVNSPRDKHIFKLSPDSSRVRNRVGRALFDVFGLENAWQIGPSVTELRRQALTSKADYYIVHLEQGLWVGADLLKRGLAVGVDMEDWYSEDLMPEARRHRPLRLLHSLEESLLRDSMHRTTTSQSMSLALAEHFGCPPPLVIYNAFPWSDRETMDGAIKDRADPKIPSLHWYSQTIGRGRGLEDLIAALPILTQPVEIHLRGKPATGFSAWLDPQLPAEWRKRIFLHDVVANDELLSRIVEHDIGFAGEQKYCKSRDLTVTNKILHYLLGGLAVVASDTTGQREVAEQSESAVSLYRTGDPTSLAEQLNGLLVNSERLKEAKVAALRTAEQIFCWEMQAPKFVRSVEAALTEKD